MLLFSLLLLFILVVLNHNHILKFIKLLLNGTLGPSLKLLRNLIWFLRELVGQLVVQVNFVDTTFILLLDVSFRSVNYQWLLPLVASGLALRPNLGQ